MITLSVVAILSIAVTPLFANAMQRHQLNACAEQVATHLRYTRRLAMDTRDAKTFSFYVSPDHGYEVTRSDFVTLENDPLDESKIFQIWFNNDPECRGVTVDFIDLPGGNSNSYLTWGTDGRPLAGYPPTLLTGTGVVRLRNAIGRLSVYVEPETGAVMVRRDVF